MKTPKTKRALDLLIALTLLLPALLIGLVVAIAIRLKLGAPIVFKQERVGLKGRIFTIYKFRSMTDARDADGNLLPDAERLPRFGQLLRKTSLDELPQLLNVLKGELSLVGPRPLLVRYLPRYSPEQNRRHDVLPGITGWAQINGRNAVSWEERFQLDVWYVDHWTLGLDLRILVLTAFKVLAREGVSAPGEATMAEFMGSPQELS